MKSTKKYSITSFWNLFRLVFVVFSLYLLVNIFYRWDGFSFYASLSEFIPSVALVSFLWSITAFLTTILVWIPTKLFERLFIQFKLSLKVEHLMFYGIINVLLGLGVWKIKKLLCPYVQTSTQLKLTVLICVVFISVYLAWLFHNKAEKLFGIIQERITPLVWLFGIFVFISVPLICFHTLGKDVAKPIPEKFFPVERNISNKVELNNGQEIPPNIILIVFDTLTARDMSLYGYYRDTTPIISEWAKGATVFSRVEASSNHTSPAIASIITGKRVWTHQVYHQAGAVPLRSDIESLPSELKNMVILMWRLLLINMLLSKR